MGVCIALEPPTWRTVTPEFGTVHRIGRYVLRFSRFGERWWAMFDLCPCHIGCTRERS